MSVSSGGPNGIRTRVSTSPRAFASESMSCGVLSQRASGGDGNPDAVSVSPRSQRAPRSGPLACSRAAPALQRRGPLLLDQRAHMPHGQSVPPGSNAQRSPSRGTASRAMRGSMRSGSNDEPSDPFNSARSAACRSRGLRSRDIAPTRSSLKSCVPAYSHTLVRHWHYPVLRQRRYGNLKRRTG